MRRSTAAGSDSDGDSDSDSARLGSARLAHVRRDARRTTGDTTSTENHSRAVCMRQAARIFASLSRKKHVSCFTALTQC